MEIKDRHGNLLQGGATSSAMRPPVESDDNSSDDGNASVEVNPLDVVLVLRILALLCSGCSALLSIGTIAVAAVARTRSQKVSTWLSIFQPVVTMPSDTLYTIVIVESCVCLGVMSLFFIILVMVPKRIIVIGQCDGTVIFFCVMTALLFGLSVYSSSVPLILVNANPSMPPGVAFVPLVRTVLLALLLITFFLGPFLLFLRE